MCFESDFLREQSIVTLKELIFAALVGFFSALAAVYAPTAGFITKDKELNIEMLRVALGVLREDPDDSQITAVRGWAVDIIK
jgi:hypothetical protein